MGYVWKTFVGIALVTAVLLWYVMQQTKQTEDRLDVRHIENQIQSRQVQKMAEDLINDAGKPRDFDKDFDKDPQMLELKKELAAARDRHQGSQKKVGESMDGLEKAMKEDGQDEVKK